MRPSFAVLLATTASLLGQAIAAPTNITDTPVMPGGVEQVQITDKNTLNATNPDPNPPVHRNKTQMFMVQSNSRLPIDLKNNIGGNVNVYITGLDPSGRMVFVTSNGQFFYPYADSSYATPREVQGSIAIPLNNAQGSTTRVVLPDFLSSGRVWYAQGTLHFYALWNSATNAPAMAQPSFANPQDPSAGVNWGFVELTNNSAGLFANISYVDFVGLPAGMSLQSSDGSTTTVQGLQRDSITQICNNLRAQSSRDGQRWGDLCQSSGGQYLRVVAPYPFTRSNGGFESYFNSYVDQVWSHFTSNTLVINTQAAPGNVNCRVSGNALNCDGDSRGYSKPTYDDIFGCNSGPFGIQSGDNGVHYAIVPRLCAAFNRGTFFSSGGDQQPNGVAQGSYYQSSPNNWYSAYVHQMETDGRGYAFSYDDVTPDGGQDKSGVVANGNPSVLTITIGGSFNVRRSKA